MFTGIIEEVGRITRLDKRPELTACTIGCQKIIEDMKAGDSIAVNGTCLTVVKYTGDSFTVEAVRETLERSTLSYAARGDRVNLERSLRASDRLGGHFVLGHVDCLGTIRKMVRGSESRVLEIEIPAAYRNQLVEKGSIAVDGISLTVAAVAGAVFTCAIIPHTYEATNLKYRQPGQPVNIECDVLGKYAGRLAGRAEENGITEEHLRRAGFIT